jgi:hypothetical protein
MTVSKLEVEIAGIQSVHVMLTSLRALFRNGALMGLTRCKVVVGPRGTKWCLYGSIYRMTVPRPGQTVHLMSWYDVLRVRLDMHRKEGRSVRELALYHHR